MLLYIIYNPTNIRNVYFYCVFYIKLCSHNCFILVKVFPLLQVCFISPFFLCYYFIFQLEEVVWEVPHLLRVYSRSESGLLYLPAAGPHRWPCGLSHPREAQDVLTPLVTFRDVEIERK